MDTNPGEHQELIDRARGGDAQACEQLLAVHRDRLRRMVAVRFDRRLAARIDPSDVVQEVMADACGQLSRYLREQPLPFYPWLRQLAWVRLIELYRKHVVAQRRSVVREESPPLPDESVMELAERLVASGSTPSRRVLRDELRTRVRQAMLELSERDREVLVMRHLEQMPMAEIAAVLGISEGSVKVRHLRALQRLRAVLDEGSSDSAP